jgi:hypothetical protein
LFDDKVLERIIGWLRDFDVDIKTGRLAADRNDFHLLCCRIARARLEAGQ